MRSRLVVAPWWVLSLILGASFGVLSALFRLVYDGGRDGGGVLGFVIGVLMTGIPFGLVMGPFTARQNRRAASAAGLEDRGELVTAGRAVTRGPVPTDPRLRTAAAKLAVHRLDELRRNRIVNLSVLGLAVLAYVAAAIFWSPWWVVAVVFFAGALVYSVILPGRLERRVTLLADPPHEPREVETSP